ncbi:hypothetical protein JKF63_07576 [Porcisia hertigi]|uniref:Uncharacterized protein n=1 Tax=Porcisia hertigi TaxID=2761500 RepID=A0A836LM47_9TRYP|nr:hypothetical protein JKF63_07576 [Porcisia hertigi]
MILRAYVRALTPLGSGSSLTSFSWSDCATGVAALRLLRRGYAARNSSYDAHRQRREEHRQDGEHCRSASPLGSASRTTAGVAAKAVSPSLHARNAFTTFLRSRNQPFVSGDTRSVSQPANDSGGSGFYAAPHPLSWLRSSAYALGSTARDDVTTERKEEEEEAKSPTNEGMSCSTLITPTNGLPWPSLPLSSRLPTGAVSQQQQQRHGLLQGEASKRGVCNLPVLSEWSLSPPKASTGGTGQKSGLRSRGPRSDGDREEVNRSEESPKGRWCAQRDCRRERNGQQPPHFPPRRHDALELARRQTSFYMAHRYRLEYEQACVQAYRILKQVEWSLARWARWRRRRRWQQQQQQQQNGGNDDAGDHLSKEKALRRMKGHRSTKELDSTFSEEDVDAVESRFFEYAGQIQRTLHALTPRHFDAVRDYRLREQARGDSLSAVAAPPSRSRPSEDAAPPRSESPADTLPQLLLLRLLWRLLHIQQLFFSIGRCASLPRTAVDVYVQSSNCQYGVREALRVLGGELARSALSVSAPPHPHSSSDQLGGEDPGGTASRSASSSSSSFLHPFSNKECFQCFYAALCIPSEEAPGVPLYDPSVGDDDDHRHHPTSRHDGTLGQRAGASTSFGSRNIALERFQRNCIATNPETTRMPLEEWCVRWWVDQYAALDPTCPVRTPPLSTGEAMDVIQACMYATRDVQVAPATGAANATQQRHQRHQRLVTPFMYFETPPQGTNNSGRPRHTNSTSALGSGGACAPEEGEASPPLRVLDRRYRPQLSGALCVNRVALRIPYHLGQRFVEVFLKYLLSSASCAPTPEEARGPSARAAESVSAAIGHLSRCSNRDAVRDVAVLCTAILFFEVFSPDTAAFMAHAAPLCREQVELLSGHEISCVLLAYASLQRWERAGGSQSGSTSTRARDSNTHTESGAGSSRCDPLHDPMVAVQSASTASVSAAAAAAHNSRACDKAWHKDAPEAAATLDYSPPTPSQQQPGYQRTDEHSSSGPSGATESSSSSSNERTSKDPQSPSQESWHLFYVTLASRAGQLSDTLSEDDVTRVLRAMELTRIEHEDLRRALESSLRMRNMGRRVLFET